MSADGSRPAPAASLAPTMSPVLAPRPAPATATSPLPLAPLAAERATPGLPEALQLPGVSSLQGYSAGAGPSRRPTITCSSPGRNACPCAGTLAAPGPTSAPTTPAGPPPARADASRKTVRFSVPPRAESSFGGSLVPHAPLLEADVDGSDDRRKLRRLSPGTMPAGAVAADDSGIVRSPVRRPSGPGPSSARRVLTTESGPGPVPRPSFDLERELRQATRRPGADLERELRRATGANRRFREMAGFAAGFAARGRVRHPGQARGPRRSAAELARIERHEIIGRTPPTIGRPDRASAASSREHRRAMQLMPNWPFESALDDLLDDDFPFDDAGLRETSSLPRSAVAAMGGEVSGRFLDGVLAPPGRTAPHTPAGEMRRAEGLPLRARMMLRERRVEHRARGPRARFPREVFEVAGGATEDVVMQPRRRAMRHMRPSRMLGVRGLSHSRLVINDDNVLRRRNAAPQSAIDALPESIAEEKDKEIRCAICLEDVEVGDVLRELPCGHRFHKKCIDGMLAFRVAVSAFRFASFLFASLTLISLSPQTGCLTMGAALWTRSAYVRCSPSSFWLTLILCS